MSVSRVVAERVTRLRTPRDAVDTAQQFHLEVDNAERRSWLMSKSRFRKAKIYDGLAVALMLATMAALGCALVLLSAPPAKAEPIDPVAVAYAAHYASAVCETLHDFPSEAGVMGIISSIQDDGLTAGQAGAAIGLSVAEVCPRFEYVLTAFIARHGSVTV